MFFFSLLACAFVPLYHTARGKVRLVLVLVLNEWWCVERVAFSFPEHPSTGFRGLPVLSACSVGPPANPANAVAPPADVAGLHVCDEWPVAHGTVMESAGVPRTTDDAVGDSSLIRAPMACIFDPPLPQTGLACVWRSERIASRLLTFLYRLGRVAGREVGWVESQA
jgi:hypothetical protein